VFGQRAVVHVVVRHRAASVSGSLTGLRRSVDVP
jgi:hypothetical protein